MQNNYVSDPALQIVGGKERAQASQGKSLDHFFFSWNEL
jgi:hypothetical protein